MLFLHKSSLPPLLMFRNDDHLQSAVPAEKLEWVTPKISLMEAEDTAGSFKKNKGGETKAPGPSTNGPS